MPTFTPTHTVLSGGQEVLLSARELQFAHVQELAKEMKKAVAGRGGYTTRWPKTRKKRGVARRNPPSASTFTATAQRRKNTIRLGNRQRHARLLESREDLRGYDNVHHEAALRTVNENWDTMSQAAFSRARRRAESNRIRRIKGEQRAAERTAGYSRVVPS